MKQQDYFWIQQLDNGHQRVGFNDHAHDDLGTISFIDVPAPGVTLTQGGKFISVEAEKAVTDLVSPVTGKLVVVNQTMVDNPMANEWLVEIA